MSVRGATLLVRSGGAAPFVIFKERALCPFSFNGTDPVGKGGWPRLNSEKRRWVGVWRNLKF
jgi:hypothetical protein